MQTADWQLLFSDRFTGARNPARLPTTDAIPSNPLRPLSISFYHLRVAPDVLTGEPHRFAMIPTTIPETGKREGESIAPLYHVILLDDDQHTYDYVVEMLGALFFLPVETAY